MVMTSHAIAERFGLHPTDLECLDLISLRGEASAGGLAQATGLTSGAVTALIDRLEKAGYVVRAADPHDRRRTLIRIRERAAAPIRAVYQPVQSEMFRLWSSFSPRDLDVIATFLCRTTGLAEACMEKNPQHAGKNCATARASKGEGSKMSEAIGIRILGPADAAMLDKVAPDVFDHAIDPALMAEFLADPRHHLAVALAGGQVVGMASAVHYVHPDKPPELWINEVGVAPPYQRRGIGRQLLEALFAHGACLAAARHGS
jgi:DNA-binding MarR family transcriptional regulator